MKDHAPQMWAMAAAGHGVHVLPGMCHMVWDGCVMVGALPTKFYCPKPTVRVALELAIMDHNFKKKKEKEKSVKFW